MNAPSNFQRVITFTICFTICLVIAWEFYWRSRQLPLDYNDDNAAWANQRIAAENARPDQTVIIGSSRVKFDIDLPVYAKESGSVPIQLALEGTCPLPALADIANNSNFGGTLLIGVTEGLFFAAGPRATSEVEKRVAYYSKWSLAQRGSFSVGQVLESQFLFLDQEKLSLNPLLKRLPVPNRPGVFSFPNFPLSFSYVEINRQTKMSPQFVNDTSAQKEMQMVWTKLGLLNKKRGVGGDTLTNILNTVKKSIDKIKARGGKVVFIRCPSVGPVWEAEQIAYPRELYWDVLLKYTNTRGIHFMDYPQLSKYDCPEWSHLTPSDAKTFTKDLVDILKKDNAFMSVAE